MSIGPNKKLVLKTCVLSNILKVLKFFSLRILTGKMFYKLGVSVNIGWLADMLLQTKRFQEV